MTDKKLTDREKAALVIHPAKRRFKGLMMPAVVATQCAAVIYTAFMAVAPMAAIIIAVSALCWCLLAVMLDDTAVKIYNTKEYLRVMLNEATIMLHAAEKEGFLPGNISSDEGTKDPDVCLNKERSNSEEDTDGKQDTDSNE